MTSMLQAGHTIAPHLGTPVHDDLKLTPVAAQKLTTSLAQQVYNHTMEMPDIAMNERLSVYRKSDTQLQGMVLSQPPNGGFSGTGPAKVVVGTSVDGIEAQSRVYPSFFDGEAKRMLVGPAANGDLTNPENPPHREHDGKHRDPKGHMSVKRASAETITGEQRRQDAYKRLNLTNSTQEPAVVAPPAPLQPPVVHAPAPLPVPVPVPTPAPAVHDQRSIADVVRSVLPKPEQLRAVESAVATLSTLQQTIEKTQKDLTSLIDKKVNLIIGILVIALVISVIFFIVAMVKTGEAASYKTKLQALGRL